MKSLNWPESISSDVNSFHICCLKSHYVTEDICHDRRPSSLNLFHVCSPKSYCVTLVHLLNLKTPVRELVQIVCTGSN